MEQLLNEFQQILKTFPNSIKPQPIEQVEKAVKTKTYLKKNLQATIDIPVKIAHSRLPPIAYLHCDILKISTQIYYYIFII